MTDADKAAYADAFDGHRKRAEREGRIIDHVTWRDGHMEVMARPTGDAPPPIDVQGSLL